MAYYAGVDLGASRARAVVADGASVIARAERPTPEGQTGIVVTEAVLEALRDACEAAGVAPDRITAVGIAAAGPLDLAEGVMESPPNIPGVDSVPLVGPTENLIAGDVTLLNDADAGVVGERRFGERTPDDLVYLTVSTGIGAGVCVDGHVLSGWDGNAGEVGHLRLDSAGELVCGCGKAGHWEAYCSGANLPRYARHLHERGDVETALPLDDLEAADLFANPDDPLAAHVIERAGEWNAHGVAALTHAYAPIVVYVGGAVVLNNPDAILEPIRERLPELVITNVPDVVVTSQGDDVVVLGALAAAASGRSFAE
jgi:glucokinase